MLYAKKAILEIIEQINGLLDQIEPHEYCRPLSEFNGNTIGQHFRHILEFFQCLEQGASSGRIDYASRVRNLMFEEHPQLAAAAFESFANTIQSLHEQLPLSLKAEFIGAERPEYPSSLGRELVFVYDHAIHHLAIIRIGLQVHFPHIQTDKSLGISPSTLKSKQLAS